MVRAEFQNVLSFSWNCEMMVGSAASHGLTRPSYRGPNSPKFNSSGFAAWAAWPDASRANAAARPITFKDLSAFNDVKRLRMGNPPVIQRLDGAAKPGRGQVQRGNT